MADIRINALANTATTPASDDYLALDGAAQGTRKILATNIANNVTDVILGTSGPSVKSTLSARAPRQGLVFDGTAGTTVASVPAFGTSDFTVAAWINKKDFTTYGVIFGGATGAFELYVNITDGKLRVINIDTAINGESSTGVQAGKWAFVTYTRSGGSAGTFYINGIAAGTITEGSPNYSTAVSQIGKDQSGSYFHGAIAPYIYNRALSASEVVALYEAGAPSGADYGASGTPASNTSLITGADSTFSAGYTWNSAGSVSITGGEAVWTGGGAIYNPTGLTITAGKKYRVTIDITQASTNGWAFAYGSGYISSGITGTGVKSYEFTAIATGGFGVQNGDGPDGKLTSITLLPIGLLLAPDAAQAGGGLVWYDTSGNAANITLPASGVSWNVPSSGTTGGNRLFTGIVDINNDLYIGSGNIIALARNNPTYNTIKRDTTNGGILLTANSNTAFLKDNGNLLIGTPTDSGNGKLQIATHTTSTGGIGFGTDTSLYRAAAGSLVLDYIGGTSPQLRLAENSTQTLRIFTDSGVGYVQTMGAKSLILSTNYTTALTLDSSQNATFAGNVAIQSGNALRLNNPANSAYASLRLDASNIVQANYDWTFAGSIAIGNTVQTAAAVASTHKVTISIGGSTYYLLATNV